MVLTFINIVKVKWAANGQGVIVSSSVLLLIVISVIGLVHIARGESMIAVQLYRCSLTNILVQIRASMYGICLTGNTEYVKMDVIFTDTSSDFGGIALAIYSAVFASWGW